MRVAVLGDLAVGDLLVGGGSVGGARLRALLARLALDAGRPVRPEVLVAALWGAEPPADQANALQSLVSRLRRVLGDPALLTSGPAGYRLVLEADAVDSVRFERLAEAGRHLLAQGRPADAAATLREALGLWRGPALADVRAAPFADAEAERLERARLAACEDRIEADLTLGRDAVRELEALTAEHPLRERLHAQLIRALAADGRGTEALAVHEQLRARLADTFGSDPGPQVRAAHLAVLRGEVPQRSHRSRSRGNLVAPLTSFVGRDDDVRRVVELLGQARLVTLVGPGGVGKTRLATTSGRQLAPAGGVWFVALAPVDVDDVPRAVLDVLPRREHTTSDDAMDRLVEALADDEPVLVLDNCEHVVDAAARLAETLLGRCPRLRVLATSREPLRIDGETLHPVRALSPPAAAALFHDRAAAVRSDFRGSAMVDEICRRLDGLPLAIELAAARLRALPIEVVAARLDDRFRLLTGGSRTALPRHQTLRAVVAWSWDLLDTDERVLLERLSAVPGSVAEDAAAAIGGLAATAPDVRDLLTALADKSLLHPTGEGDQPRYRMLETIREYGLEQLARRGELDAVRGRHVGFFLELAETAEPRLRTRDQLRWMGRLTAERDNLLAALRWAIESGDAATAFRLGAALSWYWSLRANPPESLDLLGRVLELPGPADPLARAVLVAAHALGIQAVSGPEELDAVNARLGQASDGIDPSIHPLLEEAWLAATITATRDAGPEPARERRDPWSRSYAQLIRGQLAMHTGDVDVAKDLLSGALTGFEELGERWGLAITLSTLGALLQRSGEAAGLLEMSERATRCFRELGMQAYSIENEVAAALLRARSGDVLGARQELLALLDEAGSAEAVAQVRLGLAQLERWNGLLGPAREHALVGLAAAPPGRSIPVHLVALLHGVLAQLDAASGLPDDALRRLDHPAVHLVLGWDTPVAAGIAVVAAGVELCCDRPGSAGQLLGAAAVLRGSVDLDDVDVSAIAERATTALGAVGFAAAHTAGTAMTRDEAMDLVSAILTPSRPIRELERASRTSRR